jgi:hypothetical protein
MHKQNKNRLAILFAILFAGLLTGCTTPLQKAVASGDAVTVQRLLTENPPNGNLSYTLCCASSSYTSDSPEVIQALIDHGADPNSRLMGNPALIWAARMNHPKVIRSLLENGADVNIATANGATALSFACARGYTECVKILLHYGANKDVRSGLLEWTPRDEALRGKHTEIVKLLDESAGSPVLSASARRTQRSVAAPVFAADLKAALPSLDVCLKSEYVGKPEVTDAAVHAKNKELPAFLVEATAAQKTALQAVLDQEILRAEEQMQSLNQSAKNAISSGQSSSSARKMVGFTKAYINILNEMKTILQGS